MRETRQWALLLTVEVFLLSATGQSATLRKLESQLNLVPEVAFIPTEHKQREDKTDQKDTKPFLFLEKPSSATTHVRFTPLSQLVKSSGDSLHPSVTDGGVDTVMINVLGLIPSSQQIRVLKIPRSAVIEALEGSSADQNISSEFHLTSSTSEGFPLDTLINVPTRVIVQEIPVLIEIVGNINNTSSFVFGDEHSLHADEAQATTVINVSVPNTDISQNQESDDLVLFTEIPEAGNNTSSSSVYNTAVENLQRTSTNTFTDIIKSDLTGKRLRDVGSLQKSHSGTLADSQSGKGLNSVSEDDKFSLSLPKDGVTLFEDDVPLVSISSKPPLLFSATTLQGDKHNNSGHSRGLRKFAHNGANNINDLVGTAALLPLEAVPNHTITRHFNEGFSLFILSDLKVNNTANNDSDHVSPDAATSGSAEVIISPTVTDGFNANTRVLNLINDSVKNNISSDSDTMFQAISLLTEEGQESEVFHSFQLSETGFSTVENSSQLADTDYISTTSEYPLYYDYDIHDEFVLFEEGLLEQDLSQILLNSSENVSSTTPFDSETPTTTESEIRFAETSISPVVIPKLKTINNVITITGLPASAESDAVTSAPLFLNDEGSDNLQRGLTTAASESFPTPVDVDSLMKDLDPDMLLAEILVRIDDILGSTNKETLAHTVPGILDSLAGESMIIKRTTHIPAEAEIAARTGSNNLDLMKLKNLTTEDADQTGIRLSQVENDDTKSQLTRSSSDVLGIGQQQLTKVLAGVSLSKMWTRTIAEQLDACSI